MPSTLSFGTRMREESEFKPKPMVQIGEKPILEHIIYNFASQGVKNILVLLGYKGEAIRDHFLRFREHSAPIKINLMNGHVELLGDQKFPECEITFVDTGLNSLTGERLRRAQTYLESEFFLTYGDGIADVDLNSLVQTYRNSGKRAVMTVTANSSKFGVVIRNPESGQVIGFSEKPDGHDLINMGYFILKKDLVTEIPRDTMLENEFVQKLIAQGNLHSHKHDGFFAAIDTPRDLDAINIKYKNGELNWLI